MMAKVKSYTYFLLIFFAAVFSSCLTNKATKVHEAFTFKNGVSLNHWIGNAIDSFTYADPKWFTKKDVEWIAKTGIDHIQLYVTGNEIITPDEKIIPHKIAVIDSLIRWCESLKLGVIISPGRMPALPMDSSLSREARIEKNLMKLTANLGVFANHFKDQGKNVRLLLNIGSDDKTIRNRYYQMVIPEIRKTNPERKLYVTAYSINKLSDLDIPENDKNLIIAVEMAQSTEPKADAIDVFAWQYQDYFFTDKMPRVTFPGIVPKLDTTMVTDLGRWALQFSNSKLEENYFNDKFKIAAVWMKQNHPELELYVSHFRYWTGYPYDPKTVADKESVKKFITSFSRAAKKYNIKWCFYDYNSGSGIRYPENKKSLLLEALNVGT